MKSAALFLLLLLAGCVGMPKNVEPVRSFSLERYLGRWYEIARLDHPFERGLSRVTAEYSQRDDGGVRVLNRGYSSTDEKWKEAVGKGYFVQKPDLGHLKVSFFGPFYGSYVIIELDRENYQYALVCGPDTSYLWILARTPTMDQGVKRALVAKAASLGFDTGSLIFVEHD
jgi:apolipoprotein D and lipocalin family protein